MHAPKFSTRVFVESYLFPARVKFTEVLYATSGAVAYEL